MQNPQLTGAVVDAVVALKNPQGSTAREIKKFLVSQGLIDDDINIKPAILAALKAKQISQPAASKGRFLIWDEGSFSSKGSRYARSGTLWKRKARKHTRKRKRSRSSSGRRKRRSSSRSCSSNRRSSSKRSKTSKRRMSSTSKKSKEKRKRRISRSHRSSSRSSKSNRSSKSCRGKRSKSGKCSSRAPKGKMLVMFYANKKRKRRRR